MRILFVHHDSIESGSGRCLYELLYLIKQKTEINPVVLVHNQNSLCDALNKIGVEVHACRFGYTSSSSTSKWARFFRGKVYRFLANLLAYFYLKIKINLKTIDLIHSNSMIIDFGAYLSKKINVPHVWHFREFGDLDFKLIPLMPSFDKYVNAHSDKIIAVSNAVKSHYVSKGCCSSKIECIYDGVIGKNFYSYGNFNSVDNSSLKIIMCGRLTEEKGQLILLESLCKIPDCQRDKIQVDFFGRGQDEDLLRNFVAKHSLEKYVNFRGFCMDIHTELPKYDVGLNLSRAEGFGRTTAEYMLAGLYVIGVDAGATPEILDYGAVGSLIPQNDSKALADEIIRILTNKSYYMRKASEGRKYAKGKFCIETNYMKIVDCLRSCITR